MKGDQIRGLTRSAFVLAKKRAATPTRLAMTTMRKRKESGVYLNSSGLSDSSIINWSCRKRDNDKQMILRFLWGYSVAAPRSKLMV